MIFSSSQQVGHVYNVRTWPCKRCSCKVASNVKAHDHCNAFLSVSKKTENWWEKVNVLKVIQNTNNWNKKTFGNHEKHNYSWWTWTIYGIMELEWHVEWYWNKIQQAILHGLLDWPKISNSKHHRCIEQANHQDQWSSIQRVHWLRNMHTSPDLHMIYKYDHMCKYFQIAGTYII